MVSQVIIISVLAAVLDTTFGVSHSSLVTGVCTACNFVRRSCKRANTQSCSKYIQCMQQEGQTVAANMHCSWGLFWDDNVATCNWPEVVKCPKDPCVSDPGAAPYPMDGNCRGYWSCNIRGFSEAVCCPSGTRFVHLQGCITDQTCNVPCPGIFDDYYGVTTTTVAPACPYHPADPEGKTFTGRGTLQVMPCGAGKVFNTTYCACIQVSNETEPCTPTCDLQFNGTDIVDLTDQRTAFTANGVEGSGVFLGGSSVTIWKYDRTPFGDTIVINFRFLDIPGGPHDQTILSNCEGEGLDQPSLAIELNRVNKTLIFRGATYTETADLIVPYKAGAWNEVFYIHSNGSLQAVSIPINSNGTRGDLEKNSQQLQGIIRSSISPLRIGSCRDRVDGFYGLIDRITFYGCDPLEQAAEAAATTTAAPTPPPTTRGADTNLNNF